MPGPRQPTDLLKATGRKHLSRAEEAADALDQRDQEAAEDWSRIQDRYFKQARACANDMGLTVTSRCRLVIPEDLRPKEDDNPFLQLIQAGGRYA